MGRGSVFGGRHHTDGKRISSLLSCFSTYTELKKNRLPSGLFRADECALHRLCSRKEKEKEENPCTSVGQLWCRRSRRKRGRPTCGKPRVLKGKIGRITWYYSLSLYFFSPFASLSSTPSGRNPISNQASHWARKVERESLDLLLLLRGGCLRAAPHRCRVRWREHRTSKDTRRGLHFDIIRPAVKIVAALTKTFAAASDEIGLLA